MRGPNAAALEAEVQAVVASIKYDPAVIPLPTDPAARAAQSQQALTQALTQALGLGDPRTLDCFAREPGSKAATITFPPNGRNLSKPLPVTCSAAVESNPMEGWSVILTVTWQAASDRKAGRWTATIYVKHAHMTIMPGENDEFPYELPLGPQPG